MLSNDAINERIQRHRTTQITLAVANADGKPVANASVTVEMVRHKFLFGCNAFGLGGDVFAPGELNMDGLNGLYAKVYAALLNYATLPFYWGHYEAKQGTTNEPRVRLMAEWCREHGIATKGHPLCWQEGEPTWVPSIPLPEVESLQMGRIRRECSGFAGLVDRWDVVNEAVSMPTSQGGKPVTTQLCQKIGRVNLIKRCFAEARRAHPKAELLLNETTTDHRFDDLLRECLDAGVGIDVIGIQSHMHKGYQGAEWAWERCERLSQFGKPLHFTELTILSGKDKTDDDWHAFHPGWDSTPEGEEQQAAQVTEFYRVLFSHPSMAAITWWDFSDRSAWQGAPAGLVRKDMSPKPAYEALMGLVKGQWWTGPLHLGTDAAGKVNYRGYLGEYCVKTEAGNANFSVAQPGREHLSVRVPPRART